MEMASASPPAYMPTAPPQPTPPNAYKAQTMPPSSPPGYMQVPCNVSQVAPPKQYKDAYLKIAFLVVVCVAVIAISALVYGYVDAMRQVREAQENSRAMWREAWDAREESWQAKGDTLAALEKAKILAKKVSDVQGEVIAAQEQNEDLQRKVSQAEEDALKTRAEWRRRKEEADQILRKVAKTKVDLQSAQTECDHAHQVVEGVLGELRKLREKLDDEKQDGSFWRSGGSSTKTAPPEWMKCSVLALLCLLYIAL